MGWINNRLLDSWFGGGKLPRQHWPKSIIDYKKWIFHPLKRRVAKYWVLILQKIFGMRVIAITGSAGKTTTKEMLFSILSLEGEAIRSYANIDPVYNIPTTILQCALGTKYLVLEMGVEYPGEIDFYCWIVRPDAVVITNILPTHLEFFGSVQGVCKEKTRLIDYLSDKKNLVLNRDDQYLKKIKSKGIWFGKKGDVRANNIKFSPAGSSFDLWVNEQMISVSIPMVGEQFVLNALAAAGVSCLFRVSVEAMKKGLANFSRPEHRMSLVEIRKGVWIIDETYNNNPSAARAALETVKRIQKKQSVNIVFGDMLELGQHELRYHREIGRVIAKLKPIVVIGVGCRSKVLLDEIKKLSKVTRVFWVSDWRGVKNKLDPFMKKNSLTLIKGSRSVGLDRVISQLL